MSQTALGGFQNEDWVVDQFNGHRGGSCGAGWLDAMGYRNFSRVCAQTTRKMGFYNKADVLVLVDDNVEWISVKKFIASFNQIDKRRVSEFAKLWKMSDAVADSLRMYCGEEGYRPGDICKPISSGRDPRRFFMDELPNGQSEQVVSFLNKKKKKIIQDVMAGRGRGAARWMLAVEERLDAPPKSALVRMDDVVRHYAEGSTFITRKGNLRLGRITIQRKGGDAGKKTAQMLQFKFSPRDLFTIEESYVFEDCAY